LAKQEQEEAEKAKAGAAGDAQGAAAKEPEVEVPLYAKELQQLEVLAATLRKHLPAGEDKAGSGAQEEKKGPSVEVPQGEQPQLGGLALKVILSQCGNMTLRGKLLLLQIQA
jgi:hypothetical protein